MKSAVQKGAGMNMAEPYSKIEKLDYKKTLLPPEKIINMKGPGNVKGVNNSEDHKRPRHS